MSFCLPTCMDNLLGMNQTKYLIRPIIMIIAIRRRKKKTPSLIINSLTHVCISGRRFFFKDLFMFHKAELFRMAYNS